MKKIFIIFILVICIVFGGCGNLIEKVKHVNDPPLYVEDVHGTLVPAIQGADTSELDPTLFYKDSNGRMAYSDANVKMLTGIDVSVFQGEIDWDKVKADGIDFVFIRCGGRGYGSEGVMYEDESFAENCKKASAAGIETGAYFYSQAINEAEASEEAAFVINMVKGLPITFPVVFDWEPVLTEGARTADITGEQVTAFAKVFCNAIKNAGYDPMVYLNCEYGYFKYDLNSIGDYKVWLAEYSEIPSYYYNYKVWQYDKQGTVDGINGHVDMNIAVSDMIVG